MELSPILSSFNLLFLSIILFSNLKIFFNLTSLYCGCLSYNFSSTSVNKSVFLQIKDSSISSLSSSVINITLINFSPGYNSTLYLEIISFFSSFNFLFSFSILSISFLILLSSNDINLLDK